DGWRAYVDGKEVPIARVDYVLRAIEVPQGDHEIKFEFKPTSIAMTETIAYVSIAILVIGLLFIGYKQFK
ncbi:MAG: YfhO family protein, partial [Bacteroidales bacterium]